MKKPIPGKRTRNRAIFKPPILRKMTRICIGKKEKKRHEALESLKNREREKKNGGEFRKDQVKYGGGSSWGLIGIRERVGRKGKRSQFKSPVRKGHRTS